jgi:hypothetical protein
LHRFYADIGDVLLGKSGSKDNERTSISMLLFSILDAVSRKSTLSLLSAEGKSRSTDKPFTFFSPEHNREFIATEGVKLKVEQEPNNPSKLRLVLNGVNILDWFREKAQEVRLKVMPKRSRIKM